VSDGANWYVSNNLDYYYVIPDARIKYNFENDANNQADDTSGNNNTGSFVGSPQYTSNSAFDSLALSTDGSEGVNCPDIGLIRPTNDWTVVLFFKDSNISNGVRYYWSGRANYDIKLKYSGSLEFAYYQGGKASTDGTAVSNDTWHMACIRNDYSNGVRSIAVDTVDYGTNNDFSAKSRSNSNNVGYTDGNGNNPVDVDGYFLFDFILSKEVENSIYSNSNIS
jgi:hypothetical protein